MRVIGIDYTLQMCIRVRMVRAQIVLNEPIAEQLRAVSTRTGSSMSEIVRRALIAYFDHEEPDVSWMGSLHVDPAISHDMNDIRASIAAGRVRELGL